MRLRPFRPTATAKRKKPPVQLNATASRAVRRPHEDDYEEEDYYEASEPNMKLSHAFIVVLILHLIAVAGIFGFNSLKNRQNALAKINEEAAAPAVTSAATEPSSPARTVVTSANASTAAAPTSAAVAGGSAHTVVPGDTLTRIARQYSTSIEAIEAANGLTSESILRVGQVLQIPEAGATVASTSPAAPARKTTPPPAKPAETAPTNTTATSPAPATPSSTTTAASSAPATTTSAPATAGATANGETEIYEVVAGDNPYSIARRLGVSYQALVEFNKIEDPTKLQIGQKLKIPR